MNGHQNAHKKERDAEKLQTEAHRNNLPNSTRSGVFHPYSSPEMRVDSKANRSYFVGQIVDSSSSSSSRTSRYLEGFHTGMRREEFLRLAPRSAPLAPRPPASLAPRPHAPLAPPPPPRSTMFFGVPGFFRPSVPPTNPPNDGASITSSSCVVIMDNKEVKDEVEEKDLDLDLKL